MRVQWRREWTAPSVVGVVSFAIGAGVGYAACLYQKRLIKNVSDSIDEVSAGLGHLHTKIEENAESVLQASWDIIKTLSAQNAPEHTEQESTEGILKGITIPEGMTVFPKEDYDWNYDEEMKTRTEERPYILHRNEFDDEEKGYTHSTLTYYRGDDILADEHEVPIHNAGQVVGDDNLLFGKGSEDPSLVYIRNDRLEAEYEIILDHGFYQVEVLGAEIENRLNTEKSVVPKFRPE